MKLQKILRSYQGFSMVEITVALGLLGLATMAVMNLSENVTNSTRRAEMMLSKSQFASALGGYINSSQACNELTGMPAFTSTPRPIVIRDWKIAGMNEEILKDIGANKKFKNFTLKSLNASIDTTPGLPTVAMKNSSGAMTTYTKTFVNVVATLEVNLKAGDPDSSPKREYEYFYNIPVLAAAGKVAFCNEEKSIRETCAAMKGEFDPVTKKCELDEVCQVQGAFSRCIAGTCPGPQGPAKPNPLIGSANCPAGSTTVPTGAINWNHTIPCTGKKCTPTPASSTLAYYSCMKCSDNPGGGGGGVTGYSGGGVTGYGGGGGGGGGCFVAGTEISLYGGGVKNIEDVKVGDILVDHQGSEVTVTALKNYEYDGLVFSVNNGPFFFTPNHPLLTTTGWKSLNPQESMKESPGINVSTLKVGDILVKKKGFEVIKTLNSEKIKDRVYNFTVSGSHEYIADDYAVHNVKEMLESPHAH